MRLTASQIATTLASGPPPGLDPGVCARETIHIPGAIQPHGALIVTSEPGWLVLQASANLQQVLGFSAANALGQPLEDLIGEAAFALLQVARRRERTPIGPIPGRGDAGRSLHLHAYWSGDRVCIDIEPVGSEPRRAPAVVVVQSVLDTFKHATSMAELCDLAAAGLQAVSGYDRVMVYRFGEHGEGQVIAEAQAGHLETYLGNHYPTTDIPPQARALYMRQRVGAVADSAYRPAELLVDKTLDDGSPLDLTHSALRSVSPIHREFMRNMGTAASLSIALSYGSELWGLLLCHHASPRIASPDLRAVADMIGQVVSLLLRNHDETEVAAQRVQRSAALGRLIGCLHAPLPLPEIYAAAEADILHLVNASGAVIHAAGTVILLGRTPDLATVERTLAVLRPKLPPGPVGKIVAIDDLSLRYPELSGSLPDGAGVLLLPFQSGLDDLILWYRPELSRIVTWAGDPAKPHETSPSDGTIKPRASFAAWKQTVHFHSAPWTPADLALAADLRGAIEVEVALRAKNELVLLTHYQELSDKLEVQVGQRTRALESATREQLKTEAALQQAQKMEAIGQLTGGVAHDFNNILAAILSNLDLAQARTPDPAVERFLLHAQHAAERGAKLTDQLLSFARKQPLRREASDLNQLALGFKTLIERTIGPTVACRLELDPGLWTVLADPTQFEMALLNLAVNARDAMPGGGSLVIDTKNVAAGAAELPRDLAPGDYARITMQDTGTGMSGAVASRAFEPFFTTKGIGRGTGLGLSQVYGFCKQLGGTAIVASTLGLGTRVSLWLPRAAATAKVAYEQPAATRKPAPLASRRRRVLVIDDDLDVLEATHDTLLELGFDVVTSNTASAGLAALEEDDGIEFAITDFAMPGMNGVDFIQNARLSRPRLPCLLMTGYADISALEDILTKEVSILRKPFRMRELAASIDGLTACGGGTLQH